MPPQSYTPDVIKLLRMAHLRGVMVKVIGG
jgi:hypothetical protein